MSVLAADLGATRIKLALVDDGRVLARRLLPARPAEELKSTLLAVEEAFKALCANVGVAVQSCDGLALGFPSLIDIRSGRVLEYARYRNVAQVDLRDWAKQRLGLFAAIENDARMACIGEWRCGAGRGIDNLVMITLGTGIGTGVIIEGQVLRGKHGQAGCLGGHLTVRHGGRICDCGNAGCAEAEASTAFLPQLAATTPGWEGSALQREPTLDYATVLRLADCGDAFTQKIINYSLSVWSSLAVSLIHAYDPEMVVLGGGIMAGADALLPAIRRYVHAHVHTPWGQVKIAASELGDDAGTVAAEWLVAEQKRLILGST